jgi:hypothetical protein
MEWQAICQPVETGLPLARMIAWLGRPAISRRAGGGMGFADLLPDMQKEVNKEHSHPLADQSRIVLFTADQLENPQLCSLVSMVHSGRRGR